MVAFFVLLFRIQKGPGSNRRPVGVYLE